MINISIILNKLTKPEAKVKTKECPIKKIQELIDIVDKERDSDESEAAWEKLKKLYTKLTDSECKMKNKDELLKLITPTIRRYMQYDPEGVELSTEHLTED